MYKKLAEFQQSNTRTGSYSNRPSFSGKNENGVDMGALRQSTDLTVNELEVLRRVKMQELREHNEKLDEQKAYVKRAARAGYTKGIYLSPEHFSNAQEKAIRMGREAVRLQEELGEINSMIKAARTKSFQRNFYEAAQELLADEVFNKIRHLAEIRTSG